MGNRLSKIYTRTGDKGTTGLGDGSRIEKDDIRIDAIGDIDELNCLVGMVVSGLDQNDELIPSLYEIQQNLFNLGGELSVPGYELIKPEHISELEQHLDAFNEDLPPLTDFILPGGNLAASYCHLARSVCRRAERKMVSLSKATTIRSECQAYLNRLSDLLFVYSRVLARRDGEEEILWTRRKEQLAAKKAEADSDQ